jgi:hypothetical protein
MMGTWIPQKGDAVVDLRLGSITGRVGLTVTVERVTASLVVTSDGERYHLNTLRPVSEGSGSARQLVRATDDRVLIVRGHERLAAVARTADNLAKIDHQRPEDVLSAFAQIIMAASVARHAFAELMVDATRAEQESQR